MNFSYKNNQFDKKKKKCYILRLNIIFIFIVCNFSNYDSRLTTVTTVFDIFLWPALHVIANLSSENPIL